MINFRFLSGFVMALVIVSPAPAYAQWGDAWSTFTDLFGPGEECNNSACGGDPMDPNFEDLGNSTARSSSGNGACPTDLNLRFQEYSATASEVRWDADPEIYVGYEVQLRYSQKMNSRWSKADVPINDGGQGSVWIDSYQELVRHAMQTHPTLKYGGEDDIRLTGRDMYRLQATLRSGGT